MNSQLEWKPSASLSYVGAHHSRVVSTAVRTATPQLFVPGGQASTWRGAIRDPSYVPDRVLYLRPDVCELSGGVNTGPQGYVRCVLLQKAQVLYECCCFLKIMPLRFSELARAMHS
eukprot:COSAG03_NODE_904_length_5401_cov_5.693135_3_plen_116_part_00